MEAASVEPEIIKVRCCCPKTAPCPTCGKPGRRKNKTPLVRRVRTIAYKRIVFLEIRYAEYRATCDCCKTFRTAPPGVDLKCLYDNKVREAVLDRILQDGMNIQRVRTALARDFLLDLSEGFVYDCLHKQACRVDMAEYREWTRKHFSGTMCIDELHLGRYTLLLATDPVGDFPVGFALVSHNDQDHMRRFLGNLKAHGIEPTTVISDGSNLYPTLLAELWPDAQHQLCVFHVMQDLNKQVLDAVKRMRRQMARSGNRGCKRKRGRPTKAQRHAHKRQKKTVKDKAYFVFKRRFLIVKRREEMSDNEQNDLRMMLQYLPGLRNLRTFVDRLHVLFEPNQSLHQARCRRAALAGNADFSRVPELAAAIKMLKPEKFEKMIAFLHNPANRRIRTNNHVERTNRKLRYFEKMRYKWRRRRSIVRFIVLAIQQWWKEKLSAAARATKSSRTKTPMSSMTKTPIPKTSQARKAA